MHGYFLRSGFRKGLKSDCDINGRKKKSETEKEREEVREGEREGGNPLSRIIFRGRGREIFLSACRLFYWSLRTM